MQVLLNYDLNVFFAHPVETIRVMEIRASSSTQWKTFDAQYIRTIAERNENNIPRLERVINIVTYMSILFEDLFCIDRCNNCV